MSGLLYKNFRLNLSSMIFSLVTAFACCLTMILVCLFSYPLRGVKAGPDDIQSLSLGFFACYFLAFWLPSMASSSLFSVDENRTCWAFAMSLPQGAKGHVEAKYYYLLAQNIVIMFIVFICDTVSCGMLGGAGNNTIFIIFAFSVCIFLTAIEVPFMIRFGSERGVAIKGAVVAGVIILAFLYLLFGDISWVFSDEDPIVALMNWLQSGDIIFWLGLFPYFSIAAYYISFRISVKLFRKGAESYEQ